MATHSSIPAWEISWTEEPGDYSPQGGKEVDTTVVTEHPRMRTHTHTHTQLKQVILFECFFFCLLATTVFLFSPET